MNPLDLTPEEELAELRKLCPPGRRPLDHMRALGQDCLEKRDSVARNIALRMAAEQRAAILRRALKAIMRSPASAVLLAIEGLAADAKHENTATMNWYDITDDHSELPLPPFRLVVARTGGGWFWTAYVQASVLARDVESAFATPDEAKAAATKALAELLGKTVAQLGGGAADAGAPAS